jgi:DNA-binding NarL/FixJ family response regulator
VTSISVQPRLVKLSWREIDALRELVKDGADNLTIGRRMGLHLETAKSHIRSAMNKCDMPSRTALAVAVVRGEIIVYGPNSRVVEF